MTASSTTARHLAFLRPAPALRRARSGRARTIASASAAPAAALAALLSMPVSPTAEACGGFFCQTLPIEQAAEQIVFRQDGDRITAMVRILYSGEAEDFSWVVPVPNAPELSLGADQTFPELDLATRPRFELERRGDECDVFDAAEATSPGSAPDSDAGDDGVTIVAEEAVGPFDTTLLSSENPDELATWLVDNGYDLSDRGRDLIAPYVEAGMLFVAVKLRNGETVDTIQPLVMEYTSDKPMIPIRLTAVAAEDDMGVLVWIVGDARAVPENYLHVTPNYARLNWYAGPQNAYSSYLQLITDAMNEVEDDGQTGDGQGFATDYADNIDRSLLDQLAPSVERERQLVAEIDALDTIGGDAADYIAAAVGGRFDSGADIGLFFDSSARLSVLRDPDVLPLPPGVDNRVYFDAQSLRENFTAGQLGLARAALADAIEEREREPLATALGLLPDGAYMTRLYTTLSAEEMTADPTFAYNTEMPDQPLTRKARLDTSCENGQPAWTLTLGEGTDRDGEVVITAEQPVPFSAPPPANDLPAAFLQARTSGDATPDVLVRAEAGRLDIAADGEATLTGSDGTPPARSSDDDDGFLGLAGPGTLAVLSLLALRRRRARPARDDD